MGICTLVLCEGSRPMMLCSLYIKDNLCPLTLGVDRGLSCVPPGGLAPPHRAGLVHDSKRHPTAQIPQILNGNTRETRLGAAIESRKAKY